jgi:hypothetical protein
MPAQVKKFSDIDFRTLKNIKKLSEMILNDQVSANWIKNVKFTCCSRGFSALALKICTKFPNIERISFVDDKFYSIFHEMVVKEGKFRTLKRIPTSKSIKGDDMFFQCLHHLKESITTIYYVDFDNADERDFRSNYTRLCNTINKYPRLEKIVVHVADIENSTFNTIDHVESLIKSNIASLRRVKLDTTGVNGSFDIFTTNMNAINAVPSVRALTLSIRNYESFPVPGDKFLNYIMKKFPNLNYLKLCNEEFEQSKMFPIDYTSTMLQSSSVVAAFLEYASKIPDCRLQNIIFPGNDLSNFILSFFPNDGAGTNSNAEFYRSLRIESSKGDSVFQLQDYNREHMVQELVQQFDENYNSLKALIDYTSSVKEKSQVVSVSYNKGGSNFESHQTQLIKHAGRYFDSLSVQISSTDELSSLLDQIIINCARLNYLTIRSNSLSYDEPFEIEKTLSKSYTIKGVDLYGYIPSSEQLQHILNKFPCLETMSVSGFLAQYSYGSKESFISICITTELKSLVISLIGESLGPEMNGIYIKLTTDDVNEHTRYCFLKTVSHWSNMVLDKYTIVEDPSEIAYNNSLIDDKFLNIKLHCKSVGKVFIPYSYTNKSIVM